MITCKDRSYNFTFFMYLVMQCIMRSVKQEFVCISVCIYILNICLLMLFLMPELINKILNYIAVIKIAGSFFKVFKKKMLLCIFINITDKKEMRFIIQTLTYFKIFYAFLVYFSINSCWTLIPFLKDKINNISYYYGLFQNLSKII